MPYINQKVWKYKWSCTQRIFG